MASSFSTTISYASAGGFTYDSTKVEFPGALVRLKMQTLGGQSFAQAFTTDSGFTYDSGKTEFTGGVVRQLDTVPADNTAYASFAVDEDMDWSDGDGTGTLAGGATISGGKLNCQGGTIKYCEFTSISLLDCNQTGCWRVLYTPNYSGSPAGTRCIFGGHGTVSSSDLLTILEHLASGQLRVNLRGNSGSGGVTNWDVGAWSPTAGVEYEIELNWDFTTGAHRLFIDGVQLGTTNTTTASRTNTYADVKVGSDHAATRAADGEFRQFTVFSAVQHTANYTPPAGPPEQYQEDTITLPTMSVPGPGSLFISFDSLAITEGGGSPRYSVKPSASANWLYWNGSVWTTSDGTYAQASTKAQMEANIGTVTGIATSSNVTFRVHTQDGGAQDSVDNLLLTTTIESGYPLTNPTVLANSGQIMDALEGFSEVATKPTNTEVKYTLVVDSVDKYWSGSAWVTSNGTYAQANTAAEINANAADLDLSAGATVKVKAFLNTDDATTRPELTSVQVDYNFFAGSPTLTTTCLVYGWVLDPSGDPVTDEITIINPTKIDTDDGFIPKNSEETVTPRASDGYWEIELTPGTYKFFIAASTETRVVPAEATKTFNDLVAG